MQVIVLLFILLFEAVLPFSGAIAATLKDSLSTSLNVYTDNADITVVNPNVSVFKTLSTHFMIGVKGAIDAVSAASIRTGGKPFVTDAVTGASKKAGGFDDIRYSPTLMGIYDDGDNDALTFGGYYSTENDYVGKAFFFNYVRQLNRQNTAIGVGASQSFDRWDPMIDRALPTDERKERRIDLSVSQLITPTLTFQLIYTALFSEGFLASPYHFLEQESFAVFERLPDARSGNAFALKMVKLLNELTSMNLAYRYYTDDWGIRSHTTNVELYRDLTERFTLGTRYRYYIQNNAEFVKPPGATTPQDPFIAVDYRYTAFNANTVGLGFIYRPGPVRALAKLIDLDKMKFKASADYYWTSKNDAIKAWYDQDRLRATFITVSLDYEF
ncbi:MAG: DUF3570 domain-containing protein [Candidatus Manganitrophus sp.]|nr:MAG: DUF3570 domain-containing protein [Candidatus Manganitrophus sp.]